MHDNSHKFCGFWPLGGRMLFFEHLGCDSSRRHTQNLVARFAPAPPATTSSLPSRRATDLLLSKPGVDSQGNAMLPDQFIINGNRRTLVTVQVSGAQTETSLGLT